MNASFAASPSKGMLVRLNAVPCRSLISRAASRITDSVLRPRKSTLSRPIDSRIGNSYWVIVLVIVFLLPRISGV